MIVLGINDGHNSSAAIVVDGKVEAAVAEERLTRRKSEYGYPFRSVEQCLEISGVLPKQIDRVALGTVMLPPSYGLVQRNTTFSVADYWREQREYWYPRFYGNSSPAYLDVFRDKINLQGFPYDQSLIQDETDAKGMLAARIKLIQEMLGVPRERISVYDHHSCHAYYGYFADSTRADSALVYVADGAGDGINGSIWVGKNGTALTPVKRTDMCNIARIYRYITLLLGMKPIEHEYKVMGLAPYTNHHHAEQAYRVFANTLQVDGLDFRYKTKPTDLFFYFKEQLEGLRFDCVAWAIQKWTEELLVEWVRNGIRSSGIHNLVFSGGVAANIKANKAICELEEVETFFASPASGDESISIGAAFQATLDHLKKEGRSGRDISVLSHLYLGKSYSDAEIERSLQESHASSKYRVSFVEPTEVANLLAQGEVVGRIAGRMEFGPRALGNRSLLADPRKPGNVKLINEMIKQRDFWMPFTPSILAERAVDYFYNPKNVNARFMTVAFDSTSLAHKDIPATLHPYDLTTRPQVVSKETNPEYYAILKAFEKITGVGALLNTSFNLHGEPIVESPLDALDTLERSGLRHVLMGNWLISKDSASSAEAVGARTEIESR